MGKKTFTTLPNLVKTASQPFMDVGKGALSSLMGGLTPPTQDYPEPAAPEAPPAPPGPEPELDQAGIDRIRGEAKLRGAQGLMAPSYLGLQQEMSPLQQRTRIATGATSGELGTDPEAFKRFHDLAFSDSSFDPTPVEKQYLGMFGESQRSQGLGGYYSALNRIYQRFM